MSMNICLRLNGQMMEFPWQTTTSDTYKVYFEDKEERIPSTPKRRWEKLRQLCYRRGWAGTLPHKREATYHFLGRDSWEKRSWKENRKWLWNYLCWIRDTPGMEIDFT